MLLATVSYELLLMLPCGAVGIVMSHRRWCGMTGLLDGILDHTSEIGVQHC